MPRLTGSLAIILLALEFAVGDEKRPAVVVAEAIKAVNDETADPAVRAAALRSLAGVPFADVKQALTASLGVRQPLPVHLAALDVLARHSSADIPAIILVAWPSMTPAVRAAASDVLFARPARTIALLDALEKKAVLRTDLEPARLQALRKSPDETVRTRAEKLLTASTPSARQEVIDNYRKSLDLKGDAGKGRAVFRETCAVCHQTGGPGEAGGPDLASVKNRSPIDLLTDIIDPSRAVLPRFVNYLLVGEDDTIVTGVITTETASAVTVRKSDGMSETVPRTKIASLRATGLSAMPEGLEDKIDLQGMADLLAYLRSTDK